MLFFYICRLGLKPLKWNGLTQCGGGGEGAFMERGLCQQRNFRQPRNLALNQRVLGLTEFAKTLCGLFRFFLYILFVEQKFLKIAVCVERFLPNTGGRGKVLNYFSTSNGGAYFNYKHVHHFILFYFKIPFYLKSRAN